MRLMRQVVPPRPVMFLLLVVACCPVARAQETPGVARALEFPATRAGEIAEAFFAALDAGDRAAFENFIRTYRSAAALERRTGEEWITSSEQFRGMVGSIVRAIRASEGIGLRHTGSPSR